MTRRIVVTELDAEGYAHSFTGVGGAGGVRVVAPADMSAREISAAIGKLHMRYRFLARKERCDRTRTGGKAPVGGGA